MKTICLYFEIHQIIHLKRYRFFDIGTDHYYYDDFENERSISDIAERSYMPALNAFQEMIRDNGKYFKLAFSIFWRRFRAVGDACSSGNNQIARIK